MYHLPVLIHARNEPVIVANALRSHPFSSVADSFDYSLTIRPTRIKHWHGACTDITRPGGVFPVSGIYYVVKEIFEQREDIITYVFVSVR